MLLTLLSCYKLNRCYIKLSLVNILEIVFVFFEILFKMLLFKGGVLIYAEHCKFKFKEIYIRNSYYPAESGHSHQGIPFPWKGVHGLQQCLGR